jgi:hypothetical protein
MMSDKIVAREGVSFFTNALRLEKPRTPAGCPSIFPQAEEKPARPVEIARAIDFRG